MSTITKKQVKHIATLAAIPISDTEATALQTAFAETLAVVHNLHQVDTSAVTPTSQVTGFESVMRDDVVTPETMFTQQEALANASKTHQGYIVVPRIIDQD